jgi:autotransporter-associated beta strand protein
MKKLIPLLALDALLPRAEAATTTLSGAGGATLPGLSWAAAGNWSPTAVPGSNDNAVVAASGLVDIRGSAFGGAIEIQDLAFTGASAVTLQNNSSSAPMVLSLNGERGAGVPLIFATGIVARTITGPGTNPTPQPLGLQLKASGVIDVATNTLTISCIITESGGARSLTKNGAGTLMLVGRNSYSGGTVVNAGVLELTNANSGNGRINGALMVNSGAELRLTINGGFTVDMAWKDGKDISCRLTGQSGGMARARIDGELKRGAVEEL